MDKLDSVSGKKVAEAISRAISNAVNQVFEQTPRDRQRDGKVIAVSDGILEVEIDRKRYPNVPILRNAGELRIGDIVKCIIPNNQTSQMYAIGVVDGTLDYYILPQMTNEILGGGCAIARTNENAPVAIDSNTGRLYVYTDGKADIDSSNLTDSNITSWKSALSLSNVSNYKIVTGLQAGSTSNPYSINTGLTTIYGFYTQIVNNTTNAFGEIILLHSISGGTVYCSQRSSGSGGLQQCAHYWTAIGI